MLSTIKWNIKTLALVFSHSLPLLSPYEYSADGCLFHTLIICPRHTGEETNFVTPSLSLSVGCSSAVLSLGRPLFFPDGGLYAAKKSSKCVLAE